MASSEIPLLFAPAVFAGAQTWNRIGVFHLPGMLVEPFGEISFTELIAAFVSQAEELAASSCDAAYLPGALSLAELRAARIACRKHKLAFLCEVDGDGYAHPLPALLTLQSMGAAAFGVRAAPDELPGLLELLEPYTHIPLFACSGEALSPSEVSLLAASLHSRGVSGFGGGFAASAEHRGVLAEMLSMASIPHSTVKEDTSLALADEDEVFFLAPDEIELTEPLSCSVDMADELLRADSRANVIAVRVRTPDDARLFALNAHMASRPVMFFPDTEIALKTALLLYQGRALMDRHSGLEEDVLHRMTRRYGAIAY